MKRIIRNARSINRNINRNVRSGTRTFTPLRCLAVLFAVGCLWSLTACVQAPEGVRTLAAHEQNDIPAPTNFEFDANRSYEFDPETSVPEARFRSWVGYYRGQGSHQMVIPWYVREMPRHGWELKDINYDAKKLFFTKRDESAEVTISREMDFEAGRFVNLVEVRIRPLGPESFTVEENLQMAGGGADKAEREATQPTAEPVPAVSPATGAGAVQPSSYSDNDRAMEEIEREEARRSR